MKLKIIHFRGNLAETLRKSKMIETDVLWRTERQYGVSVKLQKTFALQFIFVNMFVYHKGLYVATVWSQIAQRISESLKNFYCFLYFDLLRIEAKQEANGGYVEERTNATLRRLCSLPKRRSHLAATTAVSKKYFTDLRRKFVLCC